MLAGVVMAGGFLAPLEVVLLWEQLSLQGLTPMVRDITATLMLRDHITVLTTTAMVAATIMVVVPAITVVHVTITTDPTDIGRSTNRVHATQKRAARMTARPLSF